MKSSVFAVPILIAFSLSATKAADTFVSGKLKQEMWLNKLRPDIENGTAGPPSSLAYLDQFHVPVEQGANYAERVSGFFIPATTGNYVFFVASDDDSDLFLSTDDNPANKRLIAQETAWSNDLEWIISGGGSTLAQKRSDQFRPAGSTNAPFAGGIPLTAGTRYYIEGVHHEGTGGDDFAATFKLAADPDPENGTETALAGNLVGVLSPSGVAFVGQPLNYRVLPGSTVTLSAAVDPPTASLQWFRSGTAIAGANTSSYTTPALTAADTGATFYLAATNGTASAQSSNAVVTVGQSVPLPGAKLETWSQDTLGGVADRTLVEDPSFATAADSTTIAPTFETGVDLGDNYVNRLSGLFVPPVTGDYVFFIAADDDADLFLSTDATPANKRLIASEVDWSAFRNWTGNDGGTNNFQVEQKRSDSWVPDPANPPAAPPFANGIALVAGNKYYLEAVHHDGTGGDNLAVTYKLTAEPDPAPGAATRIITEQLAPYAEGLNGATLNITNFVQNVSGTQSRTASLTVGAVAGYQGDASGAAPTIAYQWQAAPAGSSAFTNIPGATAASYTTPLLTLGNQGTQYRVKLWAGDLATNTATTTLNVTPDTTAPTVAEVTSVNAGFNTIGLSFSELLDLASTETAANYSFGAGTVTNAVLDASGSNVTLKVSAPLSANTNLTLTINGVKDLAGNATAGVTLQFSFKAVTYRENILFDGPLAYYRFEETSGSVVTNSGSAGGNGVYYTGDEAAPNEGGTPASAKGDAGPRPPEFAGFDAANKSATFTGPDLGQEWIDTKNRYLDHRAAFSLEYWVRPVGRTNGGVAVWPGRVGIVGQNDAIEYGFISPGTIQIWTPAPNSGSLDTPYNFPDDEWHHVATIADGTAIRTYYDGALQGTSTGNNTDYGSSIYNVHIGGGGVFDATGNYFTGNIDEVAIFDKAIPATRVAEHYKAGKEGGVIVTSGGSGPGDGITLTVARSGGNLTIAWSPAGGTLQSATALTGQASDWSDVGTTNPSTVAVGTGNRFYRVKGP